LQRKHAVHLAPMFGPAEAVPNRFVLPVAPRSAPSSRSRATRRARPRALAALLLAVLSLVGCRDAKLYVAALDALPVPAAWTTAKTVTQPSTDFCANCPQVLRYYLATGEPKDLLEAARQAIVQAGFGSIQIGAPDCDVNDNTGLACTVTATKDQIRLQANIYRAGSDVDGLGLSQPGTSTIRITATNA
jgi:hypothetical protein